MRAGAGPAVLLGLTLALAGCSSASSAARPVAAAPVSLPDVTTHLPPSSTSAGQSTPASGSTTATPSTTHAPRLGPIGAASGSCRTGDPLANVYHSYRLKIVSDCITVTGTVAYVRHEDDGDIHVNLSLPPAESHLLNRLNISEQFGNLVTEIVPADQPGCTRGQPPRLPRTAYRSPSYQYGICTGADIATPRIGAKITVTGPYVLDTDHGWMEIHPVWSITVTGQASRNPHSANGLGQSPAPTASGAWCKASASPSNDGYSGDYQIYVRSNQPDRRARASDANDAWSDYTNSSGYAEIRLYLTSPGMTIHVTVGSASCMTTA
ncbi:MAG: hypothetical protein ACYDGN_05770 [Acidimicrobiales bacterium]